MFSNIIYCPELGRDISALQTAVPYAHVWIAERTKNGEDGCIAAHKGIVMMAIANELQSVFVMEDDCMFTDHFNLRDWCEKAAWAREAGFDVMVGGTVQTYFPRIAAPGMIEVAAFHSAHCVVYFASGYQKVLRAGAPFDFSIGKQHARCVVTYPFVAHQRPSFSGLLERDVDYVPLYVGYEEHLGRQLGLRN